MSREKMKKFGFWSIVLLAINSIIGTGIFLSPAGVIKVAGTYTPLVYIAAAVFAGILAVVFASASKFTRKNGAAYAYTKAAFGPDLGYYIGITRFTAGAIAWGVMATAVVRTTLGIFGGAEAQTQSNITIGFIILMAVLLLIIFSGTFVTKIFSNASTIGKVGALVIAIVAGLVIFIKTGENHFHEVNLLKDASGEFLIQPMSMTVFVGALMSAFYAYTGFESVSSAATEMHEPEKNLPRAIPLAIGIIALIYVGVVSIAMMINPVAVMNSTEPVLLASAYSNPLVKNLILYGALISMFGINIAAAFSTPRIFEAMADEGQLPSFLRKRTKRGIPLYAFVVTASMAIIVPMAFRYDMRGIMVISSVSRFLQFIVVPIAVIIFYYNKAKEPILEAKRNFTTDVIMPIIAFVLSILLMAKFDWKGQFSLADGSLNYFAIVAMILGYIVLPLILYVPMKLGKFKNN
ncbi:MAG: APC family permease [Eubacteriales bacterium]|nr:APC family permease [Eubacteriales bacterium]